MYKGKQNRGIKLLPQFTDGNIQDYMQILYNHQKQCQKAAKYLQADLAKKKLIEMKGSLQKHRKGQMIDKHQQQKRQVQAAHLEEMSQFSKYWDERIIEYQQEAQKLEDEALDRHLVEMQEYQKEIQKSLGYKQKESSQIINLRKIEDNLAKQENYAEAHHVQKQIQQLERIEYEKWSVGRNNKIKNLLTQLKNKQENEINALRQRIEQGFEEQKKIRSQEEDKLVQKYMNFIKELENHHNQEKLKFDKSSKFQSTINFSRQSNISSTSQNRQ